MGFDLKQILVSCEHASNRLPEELEAPAELLELHIAYDLGALQVARRLADSFAAPLHAGEYSRLVVDLNRTVGNSRLVRRKSDGQTIPFNRGLTEEEIERRIRLYYRPYRDGVSANVEEIIGRRGRCVHLCSHTYTPVLNGNVRGNDIGLLYDPRREPEAEIVKKLRPLLAERSGSVVWLNRPYQGTADGILPRIREAHPPDRFIGIELEVNQKFAGRPKDLAAIADAFAGCLRELLPSYPGPGSRGSAR